ncbi:hypothetical protein QTP86_013465 [Hemibagrus guttatus]|nr:hypothetical protein QTP86_013465 [Hemibagrus guttatus]
MAVVVNPGLDRSVFNETYDNPAQSNQNFSQSTTPHRTTSSTHPSSPEVNLPQKEIPLQSLHNIYPLPHSNTNIQATPSTIFSGFQNTRIIIIDDSKMKDSTEDNK